MEGAGATHVRWPAADLGAFLPPFMYVHDCADELVGLHGVGAKVGLATVAKLSELLGSTKVLPPRCLGTRRREARRGAARRNINITSCLYRLWSLFERRSNRIISSGLNRVSYSVLQDGLER